MTDEANAIAARIVRYADLVPCTNAFIDTRTPGSSAKENFTIIGPGVSENPDQHIHIAEPHGFNIGGARQPPKCVNSQHSHDTAEVFVVHSGEWRFTFGEHGEDAALDAGPGDIVSFPTRAFRGFANIGTGTGFLWSVLGGDDPGRVTWAPAVFEMARDYGLILLENGALVDTVAGQTVPAGVSPMPPTSAQDVAALDRLTDADAARLVVRANERAVARDGVVETPLIGPGAPLGWPHGFNVRRIEFSAGAALPAATRDIPEVMFVHDGDVQIAIGDDRATLAAGDTVTVPLGAQRTLSSATGATLFVVRGGDAATA